MHDGSIGSLVPDWFLALLQTPDSDRGAGDRGAGELDGR